MYLFKQRPSNDSGISAKTIAIYQNKILLLQNPDKTYELPGGHVKKDEPLMVGAAREFIEETGIPVSLKRILFRKPNRIIYHGTINSRNVKISNEHINFIFVSINNLYSISIYYKC